MSNVLIDKNKIDILANAIACKSGESLTMTLDEMVSAVDGIETGGITPTGNINISQAGTTDVTNYATATVPEATIFDSDTTYSYFTENGVRKWKVRGWINHGDGGWAEGKEYTPYFPFSAVASGTTVTPTESAQTIGGANYMMEGSITVNAISSSYVGSGVPQRSSSDLYGFYEEGSYWIGGDTGYYANDFEMAVPNGTEGTPTATKGTVSNHSVSVTPSVTNSAGYISGGTKTGTAVTVSASELVSGTLNITSSGTTNVTNYASVSVAGQALPSEVSSASVGTSKAQISAGSTTSYLNIPTGYNGTSQFYEVMPLSSVAPVGGLSVSAYGIYSAFTYDLYGFDTVTVPSGTWADKYYTYQPTISVNSSGLITADLGSRTYNMKPLTAGFNNSDTTAFTVTVDGSNTKQLSVQAGTAITPTESSQTAVDAYRYTTGSVTVNAISSNYIGTNITQRSSADLTASGSVVTAPAGYYGNAATKEIPSAEFYDSVFIGGSFTFFLDGGTVTAGIEIGSSVAVVSAAGFASTGNTVFIYGQGNSQYTLPAQSLPTSATTTYTGTRVVNIIQSTATRYINIPTGYASASKFYQLNGYQVAPLSVSANGTYSASSYDIEGFDTVNVSIPFQTIYSGSSTPSAGTGTNGDIYIQTA